jgi:methyl-accepting chemotaxis protein
MTQQNAAMVEQATAATRSLSSEAQRLGELVAQFKVSGATGLMASLPAPVSASIKAPSPAARKASAPRNPAAAAAPPVTGNLARKPATAALPEEEDWSEF